MTTSKLNGASPSGDISEKRRGAGRKEGFAAIEFFTHSAPEISFRFWDPRHDESRTLDLPDIPTSEHRRQNLDASLESPRILRPPFDRGTANWNRGLPGSFDGWNKKMGGALDVPGPDLSLRPGAPRPDLRSRRSLSFLSFVRTAFPPRASHPMEEEQGGEVEGPTKRASG
ncbi:hypothetical protein DBV15_05141 [Temnothorax longispinosus]|uniref:Uncharacterized protein n=1 Tax=Temnothorax longispinosus TaxID=300112 RepID=A0A4V3SBN6_9HYME|nr:hypothetical protein DBV15_05141 [Temnothorax longispinosus]